MQENYILSITYSLPIEDKFSSRAIKASEMERGSVMHMELSIVGIDLNELRENELVRLVARPRRDSSKGNIIDM